jgi:hypothetical protein
VANRSSMLADPFCKRSRMIFSSRSSVFTDIAVCRSYLKVQLHFAPGAVSYGNVHQIGAGSRSTQKIRRGVSTSAGHNRRSIPGEA